MARKAELYIQTQLARYLRSHHPGVIFRSDLGGIKLTIGQAVQVKKLQAGPAFPDMFICEPRNGFCGYFGEIKVSANEVYTRAGAMRRNKHIKAQYQMLEALRLRGYKADFWLGFEHARQCIDEYLRM